MFGILCLLDLNFFDGMVFFLCWVVLGWKFDVVVEDDEEVVEVVRIWFIGFDILLECFIWLVGWVRRRKMNMRERKRRNGLDFVEVFIGDKEE